MTSIPDQVHLGSAELPSHLRRAVEESARLLRAAGAMLYLVEDGGTTLRWAYDAGIRDADELAWVRSLQFPPGVGLFGRAVSENRLQGTSDYRRDPRFTHSPLLDRFVEEMDVRSMIAAPLAGSNGPIGALGAFSHEAGAFDEASGALLTALAAHAALAVDNARLIDELAASREVVAASEERYRFLTEHSPDIVTAVDAKGILTFVSGRALRLTGWAPDEVVGRPFEELVHTESRDVMRASWQARRAGPAAEQQYRLTLLHRDGSAVPVEVRSVGIVVDGEFRGSQASIRDMSDRDRMERELRRQEAEIAASEERAKLAQELHDSVTQALFSMTLTTRSAEMLLERDPSRVGEKLAELRELATDALAEMRDLIFELRPGSLDRDGLVAALRRHAAAVQGRTGMRVSVEASLAERVSPDLEEALYRIAQEALHNVVKHARATEARIALDADGQVLRLTVTDNGAGFDPASVPSGHLGLEGMRVRAQRAGAQFTVTSNPGRGTRIEVRAPIAGADLPTTPPDDASAPARAQ